MLNIKEVRRFDLRTSEGLTEIGQPAIESIGAENLHAGLATEAPMRSHEEQHRMDRSSIAQLVICGEISSVGRNLIDIGLSGTVLALGLDDDDASTHQEQSVRATVIQR